MKLLDKVSSFFVRDEEELLIDNELEDMVEERVESKKVVGGEPMAALNTNTSTASPEFMRSRISLVQNRKSQDMKIQIYTPEKFDDVSEIATALKNKRSAIVNYENLDLSEQRRICDFLNGVCYVQDGEVRRITATMVLYVPNGVEITEVKPVAVSAKPMSI